MQRQLLLLFIKQTYTSEHLTRLNVCWRDVKLHFGTGLTQLHSRNTSVGTPFKQEDKKRGGEGGGGEEEEIQRHGCKCTGAGTDGEGRGLGGEAYKAKQ